MSLYSSGMCDAFALALNKLFGWPVATVRGYFVDVDMGGDEYWVDAHAVAIAPGGLLADEHGLRKPSEVVAECRWDSVPERVKVVTVSLKEMQEAFTMGSVSEDDVEAAAVFAQSIEPYRSMLHQK